MQKWEYKVIARTYILAGGQEYKWGFDPKDKRSGEELLNDLGAQGWELVQVSVIPYASSGYMHYTFKRPAQA